ncbi:hypothetical protein PR048_007143 [Dryococelus australis]|uniref:Uncharacterized protein n=1 Tax=Dryococelus australis TaxID=614101 RepID=A0ABQ9IE17_9NEOP|nr:hypothetical protein PR048_007143 [Dryococelus australis]
MKGGRCKASLLRCHQAVAMAEVRSRTMKFAGALCERRMPSDYPVYAKNTQERNAVITYSGDSGQKMHGDKTTVWGLVPELEWQWGSGNGAAVMQWLGLLPPTKAFWVRSLVGSLPDFRMWELCWTMSLAGGFSQGTPVSPRPCIPVPHHPRVSCHVRG